MSTCRLKSPNNCAWCREPSHQQWREAAARHGLIPSSSLSNSCSFGSVTAEPPRLSEFLSAAEVAVRIHTCLECPSEEYGVYCEALFPSGCCQASWSEYVRRRVSVCPRNHWPSVRA